MRVIKACRGERKSNGGKERNEMSAHIGVRGTIVAFGRREEQKRCKNNRKITKTTKDKQIQ